ncbi:hypothetical protein C2S51_019086 [Perilla frutescens var. frutescens]|nr:hypothetical protein C2S51_019086 [Perilla frutescens var. frutescens]
MLPLCSATTNWPCPTKVSVCGGCKSLSPYCITLDANCNNLDLASFKRGPASCLYSNYVRNSKQFVSLGMVDAQSLYQNRLPNVRQCILSSYQVGIIDEPHYLGSNGMMIADNSCNSAADDQLMDCLSNVVDNTEVLPSFADVESVTSFDTSPTASHLVSDSLNMDANSLSFLETIFSDIVSNLRESAADTFNRGENLLNNLSDSVTLSLTTTLRNTNQAIDNSINEIISLINKSGGSGSSKLAGLSSELKEVSGRAGLFALDVLRGTIIVVENSLVLGSKSVGYAYSSVKEFLPPEYQEALTLSEESVGKVLNPAGTAFQQVYIAVEGFEGSLGLDPKDPLVPFVLFLGLSVTLWGSYRIVKYGGYAGDLSPEAALELLQGNENAVLVDIRPENLKERDGVPDLRRAVRFRYASVTLPEVDGSVKKLLKGGRDIEDILLAAVIRNLKIVDDRSKVLVMDADGTCSKGVARSLRKLGTKKPYLVQGGFRSWAKNGLRVKMVKPETALTIINEEAEAILDEIKPTPLKIIGYGVGFAVATYSVVEWEKTLQLIGVISLGQTLYRRVASYRDVEDLKQDVRLLLTPVRLGSRAISWVTSKFGSNGNGLPTSPSSSDVQSRVLQAAAKHESQLSDDDGAEDSSETDEKVNT